MQVNVVDLGRLLKGEGTFLSMPFTLNATTSWSALILALNTTAYTDLDMPYPFEDVFLWTGTIFTSIKNYPTTLLQAVHAYFQESEIIALYARPKALWSTDKGTSDLLCLLLNGSPLAAGVTCPCNIPVPSFDVHKNCGIDNTSQAGLWGNILRTLMLDVGGVSTPMAPCMDPGNSIIFSVGAKPFFEATVQVRRVRNLDKVTFKSVSYIGKPCSKTVVFNIVGTTCGITDAWGIPGSAPASSSVLTLDFSAQVNVLNQNVVSLECTSLPPVSLGTVCETNALNCLVVRMPSCKIFLTLEVPVSEEITDCGTTYASEILNNFACAACKLLGNHPYRRLDFSKLTLGLDFQLQDEPDILGADILSLLTPDQFGLLKTAILQASNTQLRTLISKLVVEKLEPIMRDFLASIDISSGAPLCIEFSKQPTMDCSVMPVIPIGGCNPCDLCCQCVSGGDCTPKCTQQCPCIVPFCAASNRIVPTIWSFLLKVYIAIVILCMILGTFFIRGVWM